MAREPSSSERVESLFSELHGRSLTDALAALASESTEVRELVLQLLKADRENEDSAWLNSPASGIVSEFPANSQATRMASHAGAGKSDEPYSVDAAKLQRVVGPRYVLRNQLGRGGFGVVYAARDVDLDRDVAVKFVTPTMEEPFAEATTPASLDHRNIVPVYDVGGAEGVVFIVSKLVRGKPLSAVARARQLPFRTAAKVIAQVAEAAHFAHRAGIVHRDIKPDNILIDSSRAYLCDFGLALRDQDVSMRIRLAGTPHYMSPEQAQGNAESVDGRSDVYSLAVVLYELLTERRPFRGSVSAVLQQIAQRDAPPPRQFRPEIPSALETICLRALARNVEKRFTTALDFARELRNWIREDKKAKRGPNTTAEQILDLEPIDYPEFKAQFHAFGALTGIAQQARSLLYVIPFAGSLLAMWKGRAQLGLDNLGAYVPIFLIGGLGSLGAAFRCVKSELSCENGRLSISSGLLNNTTRRVSLEQLVSVEFSQDSLGKRLGYATLTITAKGLYESVSGVRNATEIQEALEPFCTGR